MHKIGPLGAVEPSNLGNRPPGTEEVIAASTPGDWAQGEAFCANLPAMRLHSGRDDDLEAGIAGGPGDRQAMRAEIPILSDQKEELWAPLCVRRGERRRCGRGVYDVGEGHSEG